MDSNLFPTVEQFSKLTTTLFSAAMGEVGWDCFLGELTRQSGGVCTHLVGYDYEADTAAVAAYSGYDPAFMEDYANYYEAINCWAPGFAKHRAGVTVDCEAMCPTNELLKTEFYNDWLRPQEEIIQGGGALLFKDDTRVFAIGGNIRYRDADKIKQNWLRMVDLLLPHLQQAFEIRRALAGSRLETALTAQYGMQKVPAIAVLSETGKIVFANSAAQHMIASGHPLCSDQKGNLTFGCGAEQQQINQSFLRFRLSGVEQSFSAAITPSVGGPGYQMRFVKLTPEAKIALPLDATLGFSSRCTVLLVSEAQSVEKTTTSLQRRFGLTKAEAEVAVMIADGNPIRAVSDQREVSIHTVRNQVKAAMSKLGVNRQVDLARQVRMFI